MEVKAHARFIRMSPRKVRLVVDAVRGMGVNEAITQLTFMNKAASLPVKKLIESAVANAEHNAGLKKDDLVVKAITADGGPTFRRWRPRAMGRSAPIRKRTSHISVTLGLKEGAKAPAAKPKAATAEKKPAAKKETKPAAKKEVKPAAKKPAAKKAAPKKKAEAKS